MKQKISEHLLHFGQMDNLDEQKDVFPFFVGENEEVINKMKLTDFIAI
jgi:hypothetical protein